MVDPAQDSDPMSGLGIGAGIFFVVSALIALFSGGYVAGALAIIQDRIDRTLHGLTTWAVVTVLTFYLISTGIGSIIGGTASMVAGGAQTATEAAAQADESPVDRIMEELRARGIDPQQELQEQRQQLEQTSPEEAEQAAREAGQTAADGIAAAAWWTFLILLLSAIAAAVGANVGANRPVTVREHDRVDTTANRL